MRFERSLAAAFALSCATQFAQEPAAQTSPRSPPTRGTDVPDCAQYAISKENVAYPRDELRRRVEGWVAFTYKLNGDGLPSDIRLVDSEPKDVFVQAAAAALQQWRFRAGTVQDACLHIVLFNVR